MAYHRSNEDRIASICFSISRRLAKEIELKFSGLSTNSTTNSASSGSIPANRIKSDLELAILLSASIVFTFWFIAFCRIV